ncbi:MAG: 4-hydroxythreonine-4-phosphate dehydrogenase PdxA [Thermodesulfobacteriota bacterium]
MMLPVIGILLGDAAGIGPEIVSRLFETDELLRYCRPILIGDRRILEWGMKISGTTFPLQEIETPSQAQWPGAVPFIDRKNLDPSQITLGQISAISGRVTGEMLVYALQLCTKGQLAGFAFAPYNKAAMEYGGYPLLEKGKSIFARHLNWDKPFDELNVIGDLWTARVTSHIPLKQVSEHLSLKRIKRVIGLTFETLKRAGFENPRLAVAALNPHGGEDGLCGREEIEIIGPAVEAARAEGLPVSGPFPADTLFVMAMKGRFDGIITLYHDQGQIALKMMHFGKVVTVLGGLPYAITTPAHGTAFDIAGKGVADPEGMKQAVIIASRMARWRKDPGEGT